MSGERWIAFDLIGVLAEPSWRELAPAGKSEVWARLRIGTAEEAELWDADRARVYRAILSFRADRLELVRDLRAAGTRIALATNFFAPWLVELVRRTGTSELFDARVVSSEVGAAKPDPDFWRALMASGVPPGSPMVDDQLRNVETATAAGLRGLHAHAAIDLREALARIA